MACQVVYVEPVLFLYVAYCFYTIPLSNELIFYKVCLSHYNETFCAAIGSPVVGNSVEENTIQRETAQWNMYTGMVSSLLSIPIVVMLGVWSDLIGRKQILLLSVVGETMCVINYFFNTWFISAPLPLLLIGSTMSGLSGNIGGVFGSAFAYVADTSTKEKRTMRIMMLESLMALATLTSSLTGGVLIEKFGFFSVCLLNLGLFLIIIVYIMFLKESHVPVQREGKLKTLLRARSAELLRVFTTTLDKPYYKRKLFLLFVSFFFSYFQLLGVFGITVLYLMHTPLDFDIAHVGYAMAEGNGLLFLGANVISFLLVRKLGWNDYSIMLLGSLMYVLHVLGLGFASKPLHVYLSYLLFGFALHIPATRSALSKLVSSDDQGKLNSISGILQTLSSLLAGIVCNSLYKATVHLNPAFTLYVIAGVSSVTIAFSVTLKVLDRKGAKYKELCEGEEEEEEEESPRVINASGSSSLEAHGHGHANA